MFLLNLYHKITAARRRLKAYLLFAFTRASAASQFRLACYFWGTFLCTKTIQNSRHFGDTDTKLGPRILSLDFKMAALCSICAEETATERKKREEGAQKRVKRWALLLLIHLKYVFWQRPAFFRCEFAGGKFAGSIFILAMFRVVILLFMCRPEIYWFLTQSALFKFCLAHQYYNLQCLSIY